LMIEGIGRTVSDDEPGPAGAGDHFVR
jgi:hypothetical protein